MGRTEVARAGEEAAARFLARAGWRILARNLRCGRAGEIDIVAERDGVLAFVEVKTRSGDRFGAPAEAVTSRKRRRIRALARAYLQRARPGADSIRFDVIEVRAGGPEPLVTHLEGAFEA